MRLRFAIIEIPLLGTEIARRRERAEYCASESRKRRALLLNRFCDFCTPRRLRARRMAHVDGRTNAGVKKIRTPKYLTSVIELRWLECTRKCRRLRLGLREVVNESAACGSESLAARPEPSECKIEQQTCHPGPHLLLTARTRRRSKQRNLAIAAAVSKDRHK